MTWLITGGAGYIGAHIVREFLNDGQEVVVYDSLLSGLRSRIPNGCHLVQGDIRDIDNLKSVFQKNSVKGIIHLAALKSVHESIRNPDLYREINEVATKNVIKLAETFGIEKFIFSSTAAVYGNPKLGIVGEEVPARPVSPYGATKLAAEKFLAQEITSNRISGTSLRYFNVVGAADKSLIDISQNNLVPILVAKIRQNEQPEIFGTDYPTPDGTCIRDYVDVKDVARAHLKASKVVNFLPSKINIGTGAGHSVREVIKTLAAVTNLNLDPIELPRREGDATELVAKVDLARDLMQFNSKVTLTDSISSII
jgi:UDP-glucose 4-epimerase